MPTVRRNSCEKILMFVENVAKMQRGTVDKISELPEFILHTILSMLDTKEVCRTSVLSKRWYDVWSSIPVLDFQIQYFKGYWDRSMYDFFVFYDTDTIQSFLGFIDKTMQRYFTQKYRILKLNLELPMMDGKIDFLVNKWLKIAVQNQIEELKLKVRNQLVPQYRLPAILFRAKSLKGLSCKDVVMPFHETMELISLKYLTLDVKIVDMDLFQRIISFCPLVELDITTIEKLGKVSLPWTRKVNEAIDFVDSGIMQSNFKASSLRKFAYHGFCRRIMWPWNMNVVALKNLRRLEIVCATITDDVVSELAHGLVALECLILASCIMLKCIKVSSISLKKLEIVEGLELIEVTVDAPNLLEFWCNCQLETSLSLTKVLDHCNAQLFPYVLDSISTDWLVKLKKSLVETNFFKSLVVELSRSLEIEVEEEQLRDVVTCPSYKLKELKLRETSAWNPTESSLSAFLDGLFWCCHPDVLSITSSHNLTATVCYNKTIFNILKHKVHCYKHPLRSIEVEAVDSSNFLSEPSVLEIRFRLSWF